MLTFLFWNLNKNSLIRPLIRLVQHYQVDVLVLAENGIDNRKLLIGLNSIDRVEFNFLSSITCKKIDIFARFSARFVGTVHETHRLTVRQISLPARTSFLLAATHFPSKANWSDESQILESTNLVDDIIIAESKAKHNRTILVGDLNMNPFETGLVSSRGLHAVMSRTIAGKIDRTVQGKKYRYFYNPMWSLFGDAYARTPGTYFFTSAEHKTYFWNIFDQLLLRPDLVDSFDSEKLKIIDSDGEESFLTDNGIPNSETYSDHLPILFSLQI